MGLPKAYQDLAKEGAPKMLVEMLKLYGTLEVPGTKDNPVIMSWAKETKIKGYTHDSVPWCGLTMAVVAQRAGYQYPAGPLWALNWKNFGRSVPLNGAMLGDVLVFNREGGGHVSMYVGEDKYYYHILGGNQSDSVNIIRKAKSSCVAVRRPVFKIGQPKNVRKIYRAATGAISSKET